MPTAPVANRPINLSAMDLIAAAISGPTCSKRKKTERISSAPAKRLAMLLSATEVTAGSIAGARITYQPNGCGRSPSGHFVTNLAMWSLGDRPRPFRFKRAGASI